MNLKNIILSLSSLFVSLVIVEIGLRWFTVFPIHSPYANRIRDPKLLYRMDSLSLEDVDRNGFRNPRVLKEVDLVALGDSHTYGYNVRSEHSWPQQLAGMAGMSVYNFGVGGYGGLQYHYLMDEAIKLNPKYIILGLYLTNDLREICKMIREMDYWNSWAKDRGYDTKLCTNLDSPAAPKCTDVFSSLRSSLSQTAVGSLVVYFWERILPRLALLNRKLKKLYTAGLVVNEKLNKTVIKYQRIRKHERYTDSKRDEISLSWKIMKEIIKKAKEKAWSGGVGLGVIFIPSKERVFYDYLKENGYQLPGAYDKVVDNEKHLVNQCSSFLEELGLKFVDAEPYLKKELYESGNVYPYPDDGHPLEAGYKAYAQAAYDNILSAVEKRIVNGRQN